MRADNILKFKRGSQLPHAKLTEDDVRRAREEYIKGRQRLQALQRYYSVQGLADRYGVGKGTMEKVLSRQTWEHVE